MNIPTSSPTQSKKQTWIWWAVGAAVVLLCLCCVLIVIGVVIYWDTARTSTSGRATPTRPGGIFPVQPPTVVSEPTVLVEPASGGVFTLWYSYPSNSPEEDALLAAIESVESENPGITIIAENQADAEDFIELYVTYAPAGMGPDLLLAESYSFGLLLKRDAILSLGNHTTYTLSGPQVYSLDALTYNDDLYGLPIYASTVALYYNLGYLPAPPTTTEELLDIVRDGYALEIPFGAYFQYGFWGAFGGQLLDEDGRCIADQGGFVDAMYYFLDLQDAGAHVNADYVEAGERFMSGESAMIINGPWVLADYEAALGSSLGVTLLPIGPGGVSSPLVGFNTLFVNRYTTNPEGAIQAALALAGQRPAQKFADMTNTIPVHDDVYISNPLLAPFFLQAPLGTPSPPNQALENYWGPFTAMFEEVLADRLAPEDGVFRACQEMNEANGFAP
jgi:arabinogalactan oligomer/maltooligosaccharide transport system substrate-binding protein